jgi:AcrR family transcriptional regulator
MVAQVSNVPETKAHILTRAEQLFAQRGYDGVSMREIAEACEITKANIYYYFKDKESLYLQVLESNLLAMIEMLQRAAQSDHTCRARMARIAETFMRLAREKRPLIQLSLRHFSGQEHELLHGLFRRHRRQLIGSIEQVLAEGVRTGELRPLNIGLTALSFMGMMVVHLSNRSAEPLPEIPEDDLAARTVDLLFGGIQAR